MRIINDLIGKSNKAHQYLTEGTGSIASLATLAAAYNDYLRGHGIETPLDRNEWVNRLLKRLQKESDKIKQFRIEGLPPQTVHTSIRRNGFPIRFPDFSGFTVETPLSSLPSTGTSVDRYPLRGLKYFLNPNFQFKSIS